MSDNATGIPLTNDSKFLSASLSKPVTALICLELASRGAIDLDCPISRLVGEEFAESMHEGGGVITCRQLLTHSAQVPHIDSVLYGIDVPWKSPYGVVHVSHTTVRQYMEANIDTRQHSRSYSSRGYLILQVVLERCFGRTFHEIAHAAVLRASGSGCTFTAESACNPDVVRDHDETGTCMPCVWTPAVASSGMVASASDIVLAMQYALAERLRGCIADLFARPAGSNSPYTCGLHLRKDIDEKILDHGGARQGMRGILKVIPAAEVVFVMFLNGRRGVEVSRTIVGLVEELALARIALWQ